VCCNPGKIFNVVYPNGLATLFPIRLRRVFRTRCSSRVVRATGAKIFSFIQNELSRLTQKQNITVKPAYTFRCAKLFDCGQSVRLIHKSEPRVLTFCMKRKILYLKPFKGTVRLTREGRTQAGTDGD
jgi:hypothetical protein